MTRTLTALQKGTHPYQHKSSAPDTRQSLSAAVVEACFHVHAHNPFSRSVLRGLLSTHPPCMSTDTPNPSVSPMDTLAHTCIQQQDNNIVVTRRMVRHGWAKALPDTARVLTQHLTRQPAPLDAHTQHVLQHRVHTTYDILSNRQRPSWNSPSPPLTTARQAMLLCQKRGLLGQSTSAQQTQTRPVLYSHAVACVCCVDTTCRQK